MARLLLVEDEDGLARALQIGLREELYVVDRAVDGEEGLWRAKFGCYDAVILDLRLPKLHGIELCRKLRAAGSSVPVLMLTASDTTQEVVRGLDVGADDYITKPFQFTELLARLRVLLRRGAGGAAALLVVADLEVDPRSRRAWRGGEEIVLSSMEFRILEQLIRNAGSVQSKSRLTAAVWDDELGPESNVLEVYISKLRRKIDDNSSLKLLHTRRGEGYVIKVGCA